MKDLRKQITLTVVENAMIDIDNTGQERYTFNEEQFSLLIDCPKQVQEYVNALKNLLVIQKHTNKKALDKIKQLSINGVVISSHSDGNIESADYCVGDYDDESDKK